MASAFLSTHAVSRTAGILLALSLISPVAAQDWLDALAPHLTEMLKEHGAPATVVVCVKQDALETMFGRDVKIEEEVREVVLGTQVRGKAYIDAVLTVELVTNDQNAVFDMVLKGTVTSRTVGHNGPAIIRSKAVTTFVSKKRVAYEAEYGFRAAPAEISTTTRLITEGIDSQWPGLRGMVVRRVASRRVGESHAQAKSIAKRNASRRIQAAFEARVNEALLSVNQRTFVQNAADHQGLASIMADCRIATDEDCLRICWRREGKVDQIPDLPSAQLPESMIEVWLHDSIAGDNAEMLQAWAQMRDWPRRLLRPDAPVRPAISVDLPRRLPRVSVTPVEDWIVIQVGVEARSKVLAGDSKTPPPPPQRVAAE